MHNSNYNLVYNSNYYVYILHHDPNNKLNQQDSQQLNWPKDNSLHYHKFLDHFLLHDHKVPYQFLLQHGNLDYNIPIHYMAC